jgi:glycosyltransferase involved in cell wall biosynthesis
MEPRRASPLSVAVVVPVLNGARFLQDALASIDAQRRQPDEVIIVDGVSTDGSLELITAWARSRTGRTRWVSEPDRGQADAINKGLALACSEYAGWLNADDVLEPTALESVTAAVESEPTVDFVWGFCLVIDAEGRPLYIQNPFVRKDFRELRRHRNFVPQPGSFFRRSLYDTVGPLDTSYHYSFDYEFFLRLADRADARFLPQVLARFRLHAESKTGREHRAFLREERRAFRAHGGSLLSPFFLDLWRYRFVSRPLDRLREPLRRVVRKVMGLPAGARIRP